MKRSLASGLVSNATMNRWGCAVLGVLMLCSCSCGSGPYEPTLTRKVDSVSLFQDDVAACRRWAEPAPGRPGSFEERVDTCMKNKGYPVED